MITLSTVAPAGKVPEKPSDKPEEASDAWFIVGVSALVVAGILAVLLVVVFVYYRRKENSDKKSRKQFNRSRRSKVVPDQVPKPKLVEKVEPAPVAVVSIGSANTFPETPKAMAVDLISKSVNWPDAQPQASITMMPYSKSLDMTVSQSSKSKSMPSSEMPSLGESLRSKTAAVSVKSETVQVSIGDIPSQTVKPSRDSKK